MTAWGNLAEICARYLEKGRQVYVEGRIRGSAFMNRQNQPQASLEVTISQMQMLGNGQNQNGDLAEKPAGAHRRPDEEDTGDMPF